MFETISATLSATGRGRPGTQAASVCADKPKLKLYNAAWCWYCQRVRDKLDALGLNYDVIEVPIRHGERTDVIRVSGQSSVPVLVDGDTVLDDDDIIIPYLERTYGAGKAG